MYTHLCMYTGSGRGTFDGSNRRGDRESCPGYLARQRIIGGWDNEDTCVGLKTTKKSGKMVRVHVFACVRLYLFVCMYVYSYTCMPIFEYIYMW